MDRDNPLLGSKPVTLQQAPKNYLDDKTGLEVKDYVADNANMATTQSLTNDFENVNPTFSSWEMVVIVVVLLFAIKLTWTFRKNFSIVISRKKS
jgi:hypothetical protein